MRPSADRELQHRTVASKFGKYVDRLLDYRRIELGPGTVVIARRNVLGKMIREHRQTVAPAL